jgi:hypothetical protein
MLEMFCFGLSANRMKTETCSGVPQPLHDLFVCLPNFHPYVTHRKLRGPKHHQNSTNSASYQIISDHYLLSDT